MIYKNELISSHDDIISAVDNFLTGEIQALQHQWKKCMDRQGDYVEK